MSALLNQQQPRHIETTTPNTSKAPAFNPNHNPFIKAQALVLTGAFLWVIAMLVWTVATSVSVANAQVQYQAATSTTSSIASKNTTLQQEISELTSRSNLEKVASQANMTINNKNVRNVTK